MKTALIALILPLAACSMIKDDDGPGVAGSGSGNARSFAVADFTGIDLRGADDIDVRVGTGFSVRAEGPAKELDALRITREGATLKVGRRHGGGFSWGNHGSVHVFVTLPRLASASVAGSGTMTVDRVEGARFDGQMAGSGDLRVAAMAVDEARLSIAGSGDIGASGTAKTLRIEIAGSGDVDAAGLRAAQAKVEVAGSGDVRATVTGPAKVEILGSGDVDLGPDAQCTVSKMGSGSVRCR